MKKIFSILTLSVFLTLSGADSGYGNLIDSYLFKELSFGLPGARWNYWRTPENLEVRNNILTIRPQKNGKTSHAACQIGMYPTGDAYRVEFEYRSDCTFTVKLHSRYLEYLPEFLPKAECKVSPSKNWKKFSRIMKMPVNRHNTIFDLIGGKGVIEIRNLSVVEQEPANTSGRALMINGKRCPAIYWTKSDIANENNDKEAAQIFRFALRRCGGELLPIKEAVTPDDFKKTGLFIGKAAEKAGFKFNSYGRGGFASDSASGRAGISGHVWGGVYLGILNALEKMGIQYLSEENFKFPPKGNFELNNWKQSLTPAIPIRSTGCADDRTGRYHLKGFTPVRYSDYHTVVGGIPGHTGPYIMPAKEFFKTHPEFYAIQKNGKRQDPEKVSSALFHYCLSNPELIKMFANRLLEIMRQTPDTYMYSIYDGDGYQMHCHCARCKSFGNTTDLFIYFANQVAGFTAKEFPEKYLLTVSYVDTFEPPREIMPVKNTLILYCVYSDIHWGAQTYLAHKYNESGRKNLAEWNRKHSQNMALVGHTNNYPEILNIYPNRKTLYALTRFAAKNKWLYLENCGSWLTYSYGYVPGSNSFNDLWVFVQPRIAIDPAINENKLIRQYIKDHYGPAAAEIQQYYDLIQSEPERRQWVQACEQTKRGFVTKELAAKCLKLLDRAEKKTANTPFQMYVLKEKIPFLWTMLSDNSIGQMNISHKDLPQYAARLAEFCRLCKECGITHIQRKGAKEWFKKFHQLTIEKEVKWYQSPTIQKLLKNPVALMKSLLPEQQKNTKEGILLTVAAFTGGERDNAAGWMREKPAPAIVMRRPSSPFTPAQANIVLTKQPKGAVIMQISGIEDEKKERLAKMEIIINGEKIFSGQTPFEKYRWTWKNFTIPSGILKKGNNSLFIKNITPDSLSREKNYYWGWFIFDQVLFKEIQ